jgi:hypothetical protein
MAEGRAVPAALVDTVEASAAPASGAEPKSAVVLHKSSNG